MSSIQKISGKVEWIGVREPKGDIKSMDSVYAIEGLGLEGDKITKKSSKKRQVTLMQKEHISVILSLAKEEDQDLLSARGYAWGYLSSMILLVIALIPFVFGLLDSELASKLTFLLVSIWWAFFSFYSISRLPKDALSIKSNRNMIVGGYIELFSAMKKVYSQKRLSLFLASFFFYMMGVQTVFYAATLFGKQELKLDDNLLIVTMLLIQLLGAIGANVLSKLARHKGNFIALSITIVIWAGVTVFAYLMQSAVEFIIASIFVGFVMGGIQSLSRSTYSKWTYKLKDKASLFLI